MTFNALPDQLLDPLFNTATFLRLLKMHFFSNYWHLAHYADVMRYMSWFTLLTYIRRHSTIS